MRVSGLICALCALVAASGHVAQASDGTKRAKYSEYLKAHAVFSNHVRGELLIRQYRPEDPVEVLLSATVYNPTSSSYNVRINEGKSAADCARTGDLYDPNGKVSKAYKTRCAADPELCAEGDFGSRYGTLTSQNAAMNSWYSVDLPISKLFGRSLVLYNKRMQPLGCATITKDDSSRAVAKFPSGNIVGKVEFSGDDNSTSISIALTSMGEAFDRITWHINNKAVGSRRDCLDTGGTYDPTRSISKAYVAACKKDIDACAIGDIGLKFGQVAIERGIDKSGEKYARFQLEYRDRAMPIDVRAQPSVLYRTVVIVDANGDEVDCATIRPVKLHATGDLGRQKEKAVGKDGLLLTPMYARPTDNSDIGVKIALGVILPFIVIVALCLGLCFYVYRRNAGKKKYTETKRRLASTKSNMNLTTISLGDTSAEKKGGALNAFKGVFKRRDSTGSGNMATSVMMVVPPLDYGPGEQRQWQQGLTPADMAMYTPYQATQEDTSLPQAGNHAESASVPEHLVYTISPVEYSQPSDTAQHANSARTGGDANYNTNASNVQ